MLSSEHVVRSEELERSSSYLAPVATSSHLGQFAVNAEVNG